MGGPPKSSQAKASKISFCLQGCTKSHRTPTTNTRSHTCRFDPKGHIALEDLFGAGVLVLHTNKPSQTYLQWRSAREVVAAEAAAVVALPAVEEEVEAVLAVIEAAGVVPAGVLEVRVIDGLPTALIKSD